IVLEIKGKLIGKKVRSGGVKEAVREVVKEALKDAMEGSGGKTHVDILERVRELPKPVKILFVGPNGAGKTTTMAKIASMLEKEKMKSCFSASDTFRAAAIEQAKVHGSKLGVKVIAHAYGADPTAVAFDAVAHAKAEKLDAVLIDTAGRQETNKNLIEQLKKMNRVISPDLKLFIGESIAGNALVEQVKAVNEAVGLDGVILTKLDCDSKGGSVISVAKASGVPVIYLGVGQGYGELEKFDAEKVANLILG
ncbi:MAG: AAA family ATPase, partial [Candidatus Micrarchaeota archaeon]